MVNVVLIIQNSSYKIISVRGLIENNLILLVFDPKTKKTKSLFSYLTDEKTFETVHGQNGKQREIHETTDSY